MIFVLNLDEELGAHKRARAMLRYLSRSSISR